MRLINSDSQIDDVLEVGDKATGSKSSARIDGNVVTNIALLAVAIVALGFAIDSHSDSRANRELLHIQQQAWQNNFDQLLAQQRRTETESRVAINEYMEFRAKQESKHAR